MGQPNALVGQALWGFQRLFIKVRWDNKNVGVRAVGVGGLGIGRDVGKRC